MFGTTRPPHPIPNRPDQSATAVHRKGRQCWGPSSTTNRKRMGCSKGEEKKIWVKSWIGPNSRLALSQQQELHCCSEARGQSESPWGAGQQQIRESVGLEMLVSRILAPTFAACPRFFSSASEARDALDHVSEGEKKTKGLDRNRVRLVPPPYPPCLCRTVQSGSTLPSSARRRPRWFTGCCTPPTTPLSR